MPTFQGNRQALGVPLTGRPIPVKAFLRIPIASPDQHVNIVGVTKDSAGAALGTCVVDLFLTANDSLRATTISDASGNYTFEVTPSVTHYAVAYKAGSPDVAGTTVNTLVGS